MDDTISEGPLTAAACIPLRELSRSPAAVMNAVEREGRIVAISRYGRLAALLVPVPERLVLEIEGGTPMRAPIQTARVVPELGDLACRFLIDAASTPTGHWFVPDRAHRELSAVTLSQTLEELHDSGLAELVSGTRMKITRQGRAVAKALAQRGMTGYSAEAGGDDGEPAHLHAAG